MLSKAEQQNRAAEIRELQLSEEQDKIIFKGIKKQEAKAQINVLNREIEKLKKFSGQSFYSILMASMFVDGIGLMPEVGFFANFPMMFFLAIKLYGHHAILKRLFSSTVVEFFLPIIPVYSTATLWIKSNVDKKKDKLLDQVAEIKKKIK